MNKEALYYVMLLNKILLATFALVSVVLFFFLPNIIPTHWGVGGKVNAYGPSWISLLIPLLTLIIYFLWRWLPSIAVFKKNIKSLGKYYHYFITAFTLFFMVIYAGMIMTSFGYDINMTYFMIPALSLLMYFIALLLPHVKRNFFIGVKTPWTLSSDRSWQKTHRRAALLFKCYAIIILFLLVLPAEYFLWIVIVPLIFMLPYLMIYSYYEWKKDKKAIKK